MEDIMNYFKFNKVGQGLFYTGKIEGDHLNFVYDCGSSSSKKYLKTAINEYDEKDIDFIVVSHLHEDHINGLYDLIRKRKVKKIFLPYLGSNNMQLTKLLIAKSLVSNADDRFDDNFINTYRTLTNLYFSPRNSDFVQEIVYLGGEEFRENHSTQLRTVYSFSLPIFSTNWTFRMINMRLDNTTLSKLNIEIENLLKSKRTNDIDDLIRNGYLKDISDIYNSVIGKKKINLSSTILIHYPNRLSSIFDYSLRRYYWYEDDFDVKRCIPLTILTGDIKFDDYLNFEVESIIDSIPDRFIIFQVPHHGSHDNWNSYQGHSKYIHDRYVVNFGFGNKYHHPNQKVINDLSVFVSQKLVLNNQINDYCYIII